MSDNAKWIEDIMKEMARQYGKAGSTAVAQAPASSSKDSPASAIEPATIRRLVVVPETEADYSPFCPALQSSEAALSIACYVTLRPAVLYNIPGDVYDCHGEEGQPARQALMEQLKSFAGIDVLEPGFALANAILQLSDDLPIVRLITQALIKKIPVRLLFASMPCEAPAIIGQKWKAVLAELSKMGIAIGSACQCSAERPAESNPGKGRSLILEQDIDEMHRHGQTELIWSKTCIVTPLAADRARELGIKIVRTS